MSQKKTRQIALMSLLIVAMTGAMLSLVCNRRGDERVVHGFTSGLDNPGGFVLLRYSQPGSDELLLCSLDPMEATYYVRREKPEISSSAPLFRYSLSRKSFEPATLSQWTQATGNVLACIDQRALPRPTWNLDNLAHTVTFQGQTVATRGGIAFGTAAAPSGDLLAVISADGEYIPSQGIFFLGGSPRASGNRFHEVFRTDTAKRVGPVIRLAGASDDIVTSPCWAPDNRIVVYFRGNTERFWFVPFAPDDQEDQ